MRIAVVTSWLAVLCAAAPASAERFVSPGFSIAFGSRGWSFGVEVSAGTLSSQAPVVVGVVAGFEVSPFANSGEPWGRLYGEVELVTLFAGIGVGPAFLLGDNAETSVQLTPFLAIPAALVTDSRAQCKEPFPFVVPYYRFTSSSRSSAFHDVGVFGKFVYPMNGKRDECNFQ